jgi:hypothetical protein
MVPICFSVEPKTFECRFTDPASKREIGDAPLTVDPIVRLDTNVAERVL